MSVRATLDSGAWASSCGTTSSSCGEPRDPGPPLTDQARFTVRLTPRGGADRIDGVREGVLRDRVSAAPADDAANGALVRLLARELGIAPGAVRIVSGASARIKGVAVEGVTPEGLKVHWPDLTV